MDVKNEIRKDIIELKDDLQCFGSSYEALKSYGLTSMSGLRENKCEDALENFNICFHKRLYEKFER